MSSLHRYLNPGSNPKFLVTKQHSISRRAWNPSTQPVGGSFTSPADSSSASPMDVDLTPSNAMDVVVPQQDTHTQTHPRDLPMGIMDVTSLSKREVLVASIAESGITTFRSDPIQGLGSLSDMNHPTGVTYSNHRQIRNINTGIKRPLFEDTSQKQSVNTDVQKKRKKRKVMKKKKKKKSMK